MRQLQQLAEIGLTETKACCRLALTDDDKLGRDLVIAWMKELDMAVTVDPIGNIFGVRAVAQALCCRFRLKRFLDRRRSDWQRLASLRVHDHRTT